MVIVTAMNTPIRVTEGWLEGGRGGRGGIPHVLSFLSYGDKINQIRSQISFINTIAVTFPETYDLYK